MEIHLTKSVGGVTTILGKIDFRPSDLLSKPCGILGDSAPEVRAKELVDRIAPLLPPDSIVRVDNISGEYTVTFKCPV
jgi:hypothetical protein